MYLQHLFRSFLPLRNPIGFGVADFVVLATVILIAGVICLRAAAQPLWHYISARTWPAMAMAASLVILLRLLLLPVAPVPLPAGSDDFSYVLLGDTLRHARLANPTHPLHRFFEANFVLQQPTYSSIYPLGGGLALAFGKLFLGTFWAGVVVSEATFCALVWWMLRGWTSPRWALAGSLLAIFEFGPLCQWTNSYWGGAVSACAGSLVFGALPRVTRSWAAGESRRLTRYAALLGLGLTLELLTRPFEFLLLSIAAAAYMVFAWRGKVKWRAVRGAAIAAGAMLALGGGLTLLQNHAVTRSWTTLPYIESRYQYGVPTTFTFQPNPQPHRPLTPEQDLGYRAQAAIHGSGQDSIGRFFDRLGLRARFLRFFLAAPLYLALLAFLLCLRERRWMYVGGTIALFVAGTNFYPYFFPHYVAAIAALFLLAAVAGLENISRFSEPAAQMILFVCAAQFFFWYGIQLTGNGDLQPATRYESWDFLDTGDPDGRRAIAQALARQTGKQLVFVHYAPSHGFHEWIHNGAQIDRERVVWAADLGPDEDRKLLAYYPDRSAWLLEPDLQPPRLTTYAPQQPAGFESVH